MRTNGLGIHTDGSIFEQKYGSFLAGVGVHFEGIREDESYKFGKSNAIFKAEVVGIRLAV